MGFLSATLGLVSTRWKTLDEWLNVYETLLEQRDYQPQTLRNKRSSLKFIRVRLGKEPLRSIRPAHLTLAIKDIVPVQPNKARTILTDMNDVCMEAVANGWLDVNPVRDVRRPVVKVRRQRMSLDLWLRMRDQAATGTIKWLVPMLQLALVTGQRRADLANMKFNDVYDEHLHVQQQKTGARIALPLSLRLGAIDLSVGEAIEACRGYAKPGENMLRKPGGRGLRVDSLSYRFEETINALGTWERYVRPSLHECRSLAERLYRKEGVDTRALLGHKHQAMTDMYNDDRGLSGGEWKRLELKAK